MGQRKNMANRRAVKIHVLQTAHTGQGCQIVHLRTAAGEFLQCCEPGQRPQVAHRRIETGERAQAGEPGQRRQVDDLGLVDREVEQIVQRRERAEAAYRRVVAVQVLQLPHML